MSAVLARIAAFGQLLRNQDFAAGLKESEDAARIAAALAERKPSVIRSAFKALYCSRASDWRKFDELFDAYWLGTGSKRAVRVSGNSTSTQQRTLGPAISQGGSADRKRSLGDHVPQDTGDVEQNGAAGRSEGASAVEIHGTIDFRKIVDPVEIENAHRTAERLAKAMRARRTRRERARIRGRRIDLRATIRRNVNHGGTLIDLRRSQRKTKPLRLVVLLDASGSMQSYTAVFTRFIHGVLDSFHEAEAFVFHTRLVQISSALKEKDAGRAAERLSLIAEGVGGGTRIGECLASFNQWHARRVLNSRSCVMIVSDGYDTGPPELLERELKLLRQRCRRVVWLNPMMGWDSYRPEARGMQAAMPYIDLLAPAHNLDSLAALEPYLARL